jgi:hypothetical protein
MIQKPKRTQAATAARVTKQAKARHAKWCAELRAWGYRIEAPAEYNIPQAQ